MVMATAAADGTPDVTYVPSVHIVDEHRLATATEFLPFAPRNLAENPIASMLVTDAVTYDEYRLTLRFERREPRGAAFDRLRADLDVIATMTGMKFLRSLRAAEIYRVLDVDRLPKKPP